MTQGLIRRMMQKAATSVEWEDALALIGRERDAYRKFDAFQGTGAVFDNYDPAFRGSMTGTGFAKQGDFFTSSPSEASAYAAQSRRNLGEAAQPNVRPVSGTFRSPLVIDAEGRPIADVVPKNRAVSAFIRDAWKRGYDGIVFRNAMDSPMGPSDVFIAKDAATQTVPRFGGLLARLS